MKFTPLLFIIINSFSFSEVVNSIQISGNSHTQHKIIEREIHHLIPGEYDVDIALQDRNRLYNLGLFSTVEIYQKDSQYCIHVKEAPRIIPIPMIEYDEASGKWSYGGGFINTNTHGLHRRLFVGGIIFGQVSAGIIDYEDPWVIGDHVSLKIRLVDFITTNVTNEFNNRIQHIELGSGFYKNKVHKFNYSLGLNKITLLPINSFEILPKQEQNSFTFISTDYSFDTRDIHIDPTCGFHHLIGLQLNKDLKSSMDYTQFWAQFNSYHSIPIKIIEPVLHLKSTLFLQKYNTEPLLFTYQYLGGEDGVRGYSPNPIENNLAEAKEIMETINTMHFSIELQNTLIRRKDYGGVELGIDWILFSDVGFSADESFEFSMKNSIIGYGLGFRFFASGMGVIGIDFGYNPYGQQFTHLSDEN